MRIERYFAQVQSVIEVCPVVQTFNVTYDKRSTYEGFITGNLFVDDLPCKFQEFVDVDT